MGDRIEETVSYGLVSRVASIQLAQEGILARAVDYLLYYESIFFAHFSTKPLFQLHPARLASPPSLHQALRIEHQPHFHPSPLTVPTSLR